MEVLVALMVAVHLISVAAIVGGWLAHFRSPTVSLSQWWGSLGMILSGLILVVLAAGFAVLEAVDWNDPSPLMFAILLGATGLGNLAAYAVTRRLK